MSRIKKKHDSVESKVEVTPEACRYVVLGAGVGSHCLFFMRARSAYLTGILRS